VISVKDVDIHMLEGWLVVRLGMVDVEGRHLLGGLWVVRMGCRRAMATCLYTVHASLFQYKEPLMSSRIFSAAG
jgi:hypothetical protein